MKTFEEVRGSILSWTDLESGWDSYKAEPIYPISIENSIKFLELLNNDGYFKYHFHSAPDCNGYVVVELKNNSLEIAIEFSGDGKAEMAIYVGSVHFVEIFDYAQLITYLKQFDRK